MAFDGIVIETVTLQHNPESYRQENIWMGQVKRNLSGGLIHSNPKKIKKRFAISSITEAQYEELCRVAAKDAVIDFRDGIPIAEESNSRTIYETITFAPSYIYYVPLYRVRVISYDPDFKGNEITFTMVMEEV